MFDHNGVAKNPKLVPIEAEVEEFNIGIEQQPKMVKISKYLTHEDRQKYLDILKEYSDIFSWGYEDLQVYDKSIIQQTISIKQD